jgi:hypothetical protein
LVAAQVDRRSWGTQLEGIMAAWISRRRFVQGAAAGGLLAGLGDFGFMSKIGPVSAAESKLRSGMVKFQPEIEPLVRLLEETPRAALLEEIGSRIRRGLSYREVLTALLLAGIRNVQPRPVGFKFHAVLVINSAHLASIQSSEEQRWLPIFWALVEGGLRISRVVAMTGQTLSWDQGKMLIDGKVIDPPWLPTIYESVLQNVTVPEGQILIDPTTLIPGGGFGMPVTGEVHGQPSNLEVHLDPGISRNLALVPANSVVGVIVCRTWPWSRASLIY